MLHWASFYAKDNLKIKDYNIRSCSFLREGSLNCVSSCIVKNLWSQFIDRIKGGIMKRMTASCRIKLIVLFSKALKTALFSREHLQHRCQGNFRELILKYVLRL